MNTTLKSTPSRPHTQVQSLRKHNMRGLTLVELLVAMTLMLLVTFGTIAIFVSSSQGHRTVDSSQQLDDSARFAFKIIGNAIRNAGYRDSTLSKNIFLDCANTADAQPCPVLGSDGGSDTLALRFYGSGSAGAADGNMVTCTGQAVAGAPSAYNDLGLSQFWVRNDAGEPALACTSSVGGALSTENILRGVESLQVMYGVDTDNDGIPNRFVNASDITDAAGWRSVKAIRVGMVLRGARGSQQAQGNSPNLYPLGENFAANIVFAAPNDGRIRRVYTSTFMLRNDMN